MRNNNLVFRLFLHSDCFLLYKRCCRVPEYQFTEYFPPFYCYSEDEWGKTAKLIRNRQGKPKPLPYRNNEFAFKICDRANERPISLSQHSSKRVDERWRAKKNGDRDVRAESIQLMIFMVLCSLITLRSQRSAFFAWNRNSIAIDSYAIHSIQMAEISHIHCLKTQLEVRSHWIGPLTQDRFMYR